MDGDSISLRRCKRKELLIAGRVAGPGGRKHVVFVTNESGVPEISFPALLLALFDHGNS